MKQATLYIVLFLGMLACSQNNDPAPALPPAEEQPIQNLSDVSVNLPEAPGKQLVQRHCITCHSLRYIEMQPNFSEKVWQKTVDKMRNNFKAPIPDKDAAAIVAYLVMVKGEK